jgi:hypothetical protein
MAGAALKSIATKAGYSCSTFDLNRMTLKWIQAQGSEKKSANLSNFFFDWGSGSIDNCREEIDYWIAECVSVIQQYNPKILGISVFTDCSRMATKSEAKVAHNLGAKFCSSAWISNSDIAIKIGCDGNRCYTTKNTVVPESKYIAVCNSCSHIHRRHRTPTKTTACGFCCKGTFKPEYTLIFKLNPKH